jgi:hypothetical protein
MFDELVEEANRRYSERKFGPDGPPYRSIMSYAEISSDQVLAVLEVLASRLGNIEERLQWLEDLSGTGGAL